MEQQSLSDKMSTLSAIWEAYAQLIRRRNDKHTELRLQQRCMVLDKFLGHFISISLQNKGDISIGEMRNIGNELSQEFMRNVDAVTRNLSEEDATQSLEDYMLRGRGWRLLYTIDRVGAKCVTQRQDLCEVLLNLLPYCCHMKPSNPSDILNKECGRQDKVESEPGNSNLDDLCKLLCDTYNSTQSLSSCFHLISKSSKLKQLGCPSLQTRKMKRVESSTSQLSSLKGNGKGGCSRKSKNGKTKRKLTRSTPSKKVLPKSKSDTENEGSTDLNESDTPRVDDRRCKQTRMKRSLRSHIWSPFMKDEDSDTDDDYVGSLADIDNPSLSVSAYSLISIILRLLLSLGELDMNHNVRGRAISATIMPHLLYFLGQFRQQNCGDEEITGVSKAEKWLDSQHPQEHGRQQGEECKNSKDEDENVVEMDTASAGNNEALMELSAALSDEEVETLPWHGSHRTALLKQVTRAVLTLSSIVATQQNGVRILINLKVFETLLDLNILDSLIPDVRQQEMITGFKSLHTASNFNASVALDMICGAMQLMQAVYTNLPFNPSAINNANYLASKLTRPDVTSRLVRLMKYSEIRTHQLDKTSSSGESHEQELISSTESSKPGVNFTGGDENERASQSELDSRSENNEKKIDSSKETQKILTTQCSTLEGSPVDLYDYENTGMQQNKNISTQMGSSTHSNQGEKQHSHFPVNTIDPTADPIRSLGLLITTLKAVKVNYIHSMKCLKRRHRNCEYGNYYDHHHDILGVPYYTSTTTNQTENTDANHEQSPSTTQGYNISSKNSTDSSAPQRCVVSELGMVLLNYLSEAKFKASHIHLLSTLKSVGACCCLQPEKIISAIVPELPSFSPAVRSYALDTLSTILLDQFQGAHENHHHQKPKSGSGLGATLKEWEKNKTDGNGEQQLISQEATRCVHCYLEGSSPLLAGLPTAMDSGFSSCDIEEMRRQRLLERWKSLRLLRKIIISKDEGVALTCAKHLMTLAIRGNSEIKEELFFGVYLHVLHMKVRMNGVCPEYGRHQYEGALDISDKMETVTHKTESDNQNQDQNLITENTSVTVPENLSKMYPSSLLTSEESLNDSLILSGSLTPAEISSSEDASVDGAVPSSIMLLCVSALPYVLQVDKVMSIFLARGGLAKLTKLLEYEQLRAPVMSVFEALVMIDERRLRGTASDHKSAYEGGGVIHTFIDTLAKRTCTVTATLQQISLQNSKDSKSQSQNRNSPPLMSENSEFLKFYKASLRKDTGKENSQTDSQNLSREEECNETEEPSNTCNTTNRMEETLPVLLDMWKTCAKLCMNSRMFRAIYRESACLYVVQETLVLALSLLGELSDSRGFSTDNNESNSTLTSSGSSNRFNQGSNTDSCVQMRSFSNERTEEPEEAEDSTVLMTHQAKLEFIEAVMMVCFSCHTISPSQRRGQEDELWLRLNSALQSCIHLEPSRLSAVFQMLLNVALPRCPSILEYSYSQIVSMLNLREREDIADEDEVRQLLQQGLEDDGETIYTEQGYEGDTESSVAYDWKTGFEYSLQNQDAVNRCTSTCPCFPAVFRLFVELMVACHRVASRGVILHTVALRLLQTLRSSRRAVRAVCSERLLEVLVDGFRGVLVHCPANGKQSTLQEIVLSLVQVIAQSEISASELRQFLQMFQDNTETTDSLLSTLLSVIEKSGVSPNSSAVFPIKTFMPIEAVSGPPGDTDDSHGQLPPEQIVWRHAAVELDVPGLSWPPCPTGFSLALWMCVDNYQSDKSSSPTGSSKEKDLDDKEKAFPSTQRLPMSECLLVTAIGNREKVFEVWIHPKTASIVCRLTTSDATVLKDHVFENLLTPNNWHLLVITYKDVLDGSTYVGHLTLILDGWMRDEQILDHPAFYNRQKKSKRPFLCVGDARQCGAKFHTGTWKMGMLRLFRDVSLNGDFWFHLYCLGPNCESLSKCDCGELRACYTPAMLKHMVSVTHLNWDVLVGVAQQPDLDAARANQVLVYNINQPELCAVYLLPNTPTTSVYDDLGLVPQMGSQSDPLTQKPVVLGTRLRGRVKIRETSTLEKAVEQAGGIEAFLFLVAKIYEDSSKAVTKGASAEIAEHLQSKVTHILFQLIHQFPTLAQSFVDANGYSMLAKVFTTSRSIVGYQLLKVLMDACTTESVFKTSPNCKHPVLRNQLEAVIRDTEVLTQLLLQWRIWHKAGEEVTAMLFEALEALVSHKHPYHVFNLKQMQAGGVMKKIFNIYLERIQDGQPCLSLRVSQSAAKVIRNLLGSHPDLHLLMAVMDFLLLVHPAPSGFINFSPGYFYFKPWWARTKAAGSVSSQDKPRSSKSRTESEGTESKSSDRTNENYHKPTFHLETLNLSGSNLGSPSTLDSQEEGEDFKFPPLKPTNAGFEQSLDMDADQEESDFPEFKKREKALKKYSQLKDAKKSNSLGSHDFDEVDDPDKKGLSRTRSEDRAGLGSNDNGIVTDQKNSECNRKEENSAKRTLLLSPAVSEVLSEDGNKVDHVFEDLTLGEKQMYKEKSDIYNENKMEDVSDGKFTSGTGEENDQGLMWLCVNLVEFLTQIIENFPEPSLNNVFSKVVSPKSMLVLAKNPSGDMRHAVMKLLGTYLSRAPAPLIEAFIKMEGFHLLANQLRSFPVYPKHIETAVTILLRQDFTFNDRFMVGDLGELSTVQQVAPVLFLSLMDGTGYDPSLCKDSLTLLSQLLGATSIMSALLLDLGLVETMCNLATNIQQLHSSNEPNAETDESTKTLLVDVQHVLCTTAVSEFSWTGPTHFQNVEDMFTLLKALEHHEYISETDGCKKRADTARAFQISLVVKIFEYVEKRSEELTMTSQGWFTSSTSSTASSTSTKSSRPLSRKHQISTSFSHSPSSFSTSHPFPRQEFKPPSPLPTSQRNSLHQMKRSTFSSPDMMGFLSEPPQDEQSLLVSQVDSDSSGSSRQMSSPRPDTRPSRFGSFFTRKKKLIYATVTQSDLLDRFRKVLVTATDLAVMFPREEQIRPTEQRTLNFLSEPKTPSLEDRYLKHLFVTVYRFYEHSLRKDLPSKRYRNPIMHGAKETLRAQFTRLFLCIMSLKVDFDMRTYALAFIMTEQKGPDAIKSVITDKQVGMELSFYLYNLLASWKDWLNSAQRESGFSLMLILRKAGFSVNSPDQMLNQAQVNALMEDKKQIDAHFRKDLEMWLENRNKVIERISIKFDSLQRRVMEQAMAVTQDVTQLQSEERKKLVAHIKRGMTKQIQQKKQWQELVQNLTHERSVWYQSASYPQSWQLDPTEGPGRVRKRLQRCHLGIDEKFLLPQHRAKLEAETVDPPLIFLFEDDHQMSDSAALIYRLYTNEKIQHTCKCTTVSPASESKGELLVGEVCIFFVADGAITGASYTQLLLGNLDQLSITWPHTDIRELHKRWYQLQDVGLEIFLISGRTCLLAFQSPQDRNALYEILRSSLELPNLIEGERLQSVQRAWLDGEVTNYDYIMHLNKIAGRSYTDLMQYPIFPFIIRDYQSDRLNLEDERVYRNLKKPIAVQDKSREKRYKDNYEFLCQEANRPHSEDEMIRVAPFHYGSHYSNSGTVLHYLVRLPPFTRMFLSFQDSSFDIPDRTFHSVGTSWRLSSFESSTDVKELIPEFFFLPELFVNNEGFDFGIRQNGEPVSDVNLPPWCEGNPRLFVLIHRQALESAIVTDHLHEWLDLVFGYKQQGEEAVRAINVFHPSTYFGVDASAIKDTVKRQALLTMIRTYGQTPRQLFKSAHPSGQVRILSMKNEDSQRAHVRRPAQHVYGLKWGHYVGSPDLSPPVSHDIMNHSSSSIARLVALSNGLVFGLERNANVLLLQGKQRDMAVKSTDVMWAGVVTWGYHDNIIRIRSSKDKPVINFMPHTTSGSITCVESVPDCRLLFIAGSAGIINVYAMTHNSSKPSSLHIRGVRKTLYGHSGAITCLYVCQAFSILVSGSSDGTCIIWDLNRLTYVRSISSHCAQISTLTVSNTLGDIASVSQTGLNSCSLQLHTINAAHVATKEVPDMINCLSYSTAPEGKSVNVIAGGLESGAIRLWSSWDLAPLRDLIKDTPTPHPVISLTFSSDSQYMLAVSSDGTVTLWDKDVRALRAHAEKFMYFISGEEGENIKPM